MLLTRLLLPLVLFCVGATACQRRPTDLPPIAGYRAFSAALAKSDVNAAWAMIDASSRKRLETHVASVVASTDGGLKLQAPQVVLGLAGSGIRETDISVISQDNDHAELKIGTDAGPFTVKMAREAGGWRVDLSPQLAEAKIL